MDGGGLDNGHYRALFENAPGAILVLDDDANVVDSNRAAQALLKYSRPELLALRYSRLTVGEAPPPPLTCERERVEVWQTKDGEPLTVGVARERVEIDGRAFVQLFVREIERDVVRIDMERAMLVLDVVSDSVITVNLEGRVTSWNRGAEEIFGYSASEMLGQRIDSFVGADPQALIGRVLAGESMRSIEVNRRSKNGEILNLLLSLSPRRDRDGNIVEIVGTSKDMTALYRARREAEALQARWRAVVEQTFDWVAQVDRHGVILEINRTNPGCPSVEAVGHGVRELVTAETVDPLEAALSRAFDHHQSGYTVTCTVTSGRWSRNYITPVIEDGCAVRAFVLSSDITEQYQAQKTLERTQRALVDAEHIAGIGSWDWNLRTGEVHWSDGLYRLCGSDRGDRPPSLSSYLDRVHPDDRAIVSKAVDEAFSGGPKLAAEFRYLRHGEAHPLYLDAVGQVFLDDEGRPARFVGSAKDSTDEKRALAELQEREAFLQAVFDNGMNAIFVFDDEGRYLTINAAAARLLGRTPEEARKSTVADINLSPAPTAAERFRTFLERGIGSGEVEIEGGDGVHRVAIYDVVRVKKDFNLCVLFDVTKLRRTEAELRRARALDSLGVLAGGIAHDFNNILTAVTNNLSLLQQILPDDEDALSVIREARDAARRSSLLSAQLLTFAKGGAPVRTVDDIRPLLRSTAEQVLRSNEVHFDIEPDLPNVVIDRGQVAQVVQNLLINAAEASSPGKALLITVTTVDGRAVGDGVLAPGRYVAVSVADEGHGMSPAIMERVFEPYFSTKADGHGLGLAVCYSVVSRHGGHITVASTEGKGTTFAFYLPASAASSDPLPPATQPSLKPGPGGRILLIDDQVLIHQTVGRALRFLGYAVEVAFDGNEGVDLYRSAVADGRPFDAVLMDLTIPGGMGGKEAVVELRRVDPKARVLVASGYTDDAVLADPQRFGFDGAVRKPLDIEQLSAALQQLFEAS